jgi:hypothetical protein
MGVLSPPPINDDELVAPGSSNAWEEVQDVVWSLDDQIAEMEGGDQALQEGRKSDSSVFSPGCDLGHGFVLYKGSV